MKSQFFKVKKKVNFFLKKKYKIIFKLNEFL